MSAGITFASFAGQLCIYDRDSPQKPKVMIDLKSDMVRQLKIVDSEGLVLVVTKRGVHACALTSGTVLGSFDMDTLGAPMAVDVHALEAAVAFENGALAAY